MVDVDLCAHVAHILIQTVFFVAVCVIVLLIIPLTISEHLSGPPKSKHVFLYVCLSVCLSVCLFAILSIHPSIYLSLSQQKRI